MNMRKTIASVGVAALSILWSLPATASNVCFEDPLTGKKPQWISSLELNASTGEILISDPKGKELLSYSTKDGSIKAIPLPVDLPPTSITKIQGGFLLKNRDDAAIISPSYKLINVNNDKDKKTFNIRTAKNDRASGLGTLYSNWITKGSTFVGFGSKVTGIPQKNAKRFFELGFLRGEVSATSGEFRNVELLEATEETDLYLYGFPYFAANDDGIFFVKMTSPRAAIVRVGDVSSGKSFYELPAFPEDFRKIPDLDVLSVKAESSAEERFAAIEKSRIAVGLFGQGKLLYLLARQPDQSGDGTEWRLYQIDPNKSETTGFVRLPTHASHLSVVVGRDFWYVFERGPVGPRGEQDIDKVLMVPTRWITSPATSPLNISAGGAKCIPHKAATTPATKKLM
jgi:hypothetical protein